MVYQPDIFREYVLPRTNNQDYPIVLDKNQFHMKENIVLKLEILNNEWIVRGGEAYHMLFLDSPCDEIRIKDGDIISIHTVNKEKVQVIAVDVEETFQVFHKYDISPLDCLTIGKDVHSVIQYDFRDLISKNHGAIRKSADGYYLEDYSSNGIFVNYMRVSGNIRLNFGDVINIFGLHIVFLNEVIGVSSNYGNVRIDTLSLPEAVQTLDIAEFDTDKLETNKLGTRKLNAEEFYKRGPLRENDYFNRSPRNIPNLHEDEIEIEAPPNVKLTKRKPLFFTIGPSFTMAIPMMLGCMLSIFGSGSSGRSQGMYLYTGMITAVGSAVIGVIWAVLNLKYTRQSEREEEQQRFDTYGNYLMEVAETLKIKYQENTKALHGMYLSAGEYCTYGRQNANLWNRSNRHNDFLFVRLGLGDIPFQVKIKIPKERFHLEQDSLKDKPQQLFEEYKTLKNVPVGVDLREKQLWGIVGGKNKKGAVSVMYDVVAQLAANNCYTDVKLVFVYRESSRREQEQWMFAKWLPHVWSQDQKTRYVAANELEAKEVFYEIANVVRRRSEEKEKKTPKPYYILFISDAALLEGELLKKYVYEPKPEYGIATFIMAESYAGLPNVCEDVIEYDGVFQGFFNTMDTTGRRQALTFDALDVYALTDMAKRLAQIKVNEVESNADVPNSMDFLEMYGVTRLEELQVLERWRKNRTYHTMKALIGQKAGNIGCYLDIHEKYHGPHGLIAGTTGSGKSETLQTYILSLALNFSPDDIGFFVIDFKGGGMANLFSKLPHMIGQISNLSGNQVRRAMISIKSENMRRQRIFSEYGVNNINLYTRLYKENEAPFPIPHLFIIIDEFAELKREEPDFMRELISVAQVGRSLGVHLILATQKPAGTVDDNIWSNSKFRLCLRVQDKQDSNDMLHKPDAAFITQAGRCYMQVGNDEIYELFQSGFSGAVYDEHAGERAKEPAVMVTNTGKPAVAGSRAKMKRREQEKKNYYKSIVDIIMSAMFSCHILSLADMDDVQCSRLTKEVIEQMNREGMEYEASDANIKKMKNMLFLWPVRPMDSEEIAEYIIQQAVSQNIRLPEIKEKTQLEAVVEYLKKTAEENGYMHNLQLWLPVLPKKLYLRELQVNHNEFFDGHGWEEIRPAWNLEVPVGLYDDPENQSQEPLFVNFSEGGHLALCGSVVSGKSTFLQTLLYALAVKYSPKEINLYGLDFSSGMLLPFDRLPHSGGILNENDTDGIGKLFHMLGMIMEERKMLLGGGNYAQYVRAYGVKIPAVFLVIDNYAGFAEKTENAYADMVMRLSKEGVGYGMFLIVSCAGFGMAELPGRIADNLKTVICLEMGDKFKYMELMHMLSISVLPEAGIKGRGLANVGGTLLEFQTALSLEAEDDYARIKMLLKAAENMSRAWQGRCAKRIPSIPEKPVLSEFDSMEDVRRMQESADKIPIAYYQEDASVYAIELDTTYCYMISGKARTGKTNLLKLIIEESSKKHAEQMIFEKGSRELEHIAEQCHAEYISGDAELFGYMKKLLPEFARRNKMKQSGLADGMDEMEIYRLMQNEPPIFIYIADLAVFMESIYKPEAGVGNMSGFAENILAKGELHNVYFFAALNPDDTALAGAYPAFKSFTGYKRGVHLGGNTASQRIFQFQNIPYTDSGRALKRGIGLVPSKQDETNAQKIIIPMYGR